MVSSKRTFCKAKVKKIILQIPVKMENVTEQLLFGFGIREMNFQK